MGEPGTATVTDFNQCITLYVESLFPLMGGWETNDVGKVLVEVKKYWTRIVQNFFF